MMLTAVIFCIAVQVFSFAPFYVAWKQDLEKYGSDLGVPLWKRFAVWLVICPVWLLPVVTLIGGSG